MTNGGPGVTSDISGSSQTYGQGGSAGDGQQPGQAGSVIVRYRIG